MPSLRPCMVCGTPTRGSSRCPNHAWAGGWPTTSAASRGYGNAWRDLREQAFTKYGRKCSRCGTAGDKTNRLEVDHIQPKSKGGTDDLANLQILCHNCHWTKTTTDHPSYRGRT